MLKRAFLSLYVFVLLFSPPIFPGGLRSMYVLALVSLVLLMTAYRVQAKEVLNRAKLGVIVKLFLGISAYMCLVFLATMNFSNYDFLDSLGKMLLTGPVLAICITFLIAAFKSEKYSINDAFKIIIGAGLIQVVLALAAFLIPEVKSLFISVMQQNVGSTALFNAFQIETRLFGFAGDMFDRYGYGMGIMSAIPALLAYNTGRMRYLLLVPVFLLAIILNSRTGILIAAIAALPLVIATLRKHATSTRKMKATLGGILMVVIAAIGGTYLVNTVYDTGNENIKKYTVSNYESIFQLIGLGDSSESSEGTATLLFSEGFWELPAESLSLLFGTGHGKYGVEGLSHSDVGYINDIWMLGLLGVLILYSILTAYTLGAGKYGVQYRLLSVSLMLVFFVYQIKGAALYSANIGITLHILLTSLVYYYEGKSKKPERSVLKNRIASYEKD